MQIFYINVFMSMIIDHLLFHITIMYSMDFLYQKLYSISFYVILLVNRSLMMIAVVTNIIT